jgi:GDP-D-mannose dehydratase
MIALITGITGQDGSYLTEALLGRGDVVHGTVRRTSTLERSRLAHLYADPAIHNKQLFSILAAYSLRACRAFISLQFSGRHQASLLT